MRLRLLICCCALWAAPTGFGESQNTLPLTIVSKYSECVKYLTYPEDFSPSDNDPIENHVVGFVFRVTLRFKVEHTDFWDDPGFCIYIQKPTQEVQRLQIDTTMMWPAGDDRVEVDFLVTVASPGWLGCYCFPPDHEIYRPSLETLNQTDVRCEVYLQ